MPGHEVFRGGEHVAEKYGQSLAPLAIVFSRITQNAFGRFRQRAIILAGQVLLRLQIGPQFTAQTLVVSEPNQDVTALGGTFEDRFALIIEFVVVGQRCNDRDEQRTVLLIPDRELIAATIEVEQHFVAAVFMLATALQHILENDLALEFRFLAAGKIDLLDLLVDVPFFIGQEEVLVPATADKRFFFKASQTCLNASAQGQPVSVDLIQAKGDEVVHVPFHLIHISDEEENLEQLNIEGFQAGI